MAQIRSLEQLVKGLKGQPSRRLAVAAGHDPNTIQAAARAASEDIAAVTLVGDQQRIEALCREFGLDAGVFTIIDQPDVARAGAEAVELVREGKADVLMKGLIGTDKYMRLILNKERGLLPPKAVLSHVTVLDIPAYRERHDKLLIVGDVAIIPDGDGKATLFVGCDDGALYRLDATLRITGRHPCGSAVVKVAPVRVQGGKVAVSAVTQSGGVMVFDIP